MLINYAEHTVNFKILYYGARESGKTTNLIYIYNQTNPELRSELTCFEDENERTVFFDFMSIDLGEIKGFKTTYSLYSVPGQPEYNPARQNLLNGVDGIIFVIDSRNNKEQENMESFKNLEQNLQKFNISIDNIPIILQYNKRDMQNIFSLDKLEEKYNLKGYMSFETIATDGKGVFACLKTISNKILANSQ
ncbi:MAG: GTPase domain-containing protein [Candidatus Gastranaerophilales bacterium]|nr:GTPase domain-containing protein [Candidatus Gastranaerophilales bacterium]